MLLSSARWRQLYSWRLAWIDRRILGTVTPSLGFTAAGIPTRCCRAGARRRPAALRLTAIDATQGTATIRAIFMGQAEDGSIGSSPTSAIMLEVSLKPFASLLWIGSILLVLGTIIALIRRVGSSRTTQRRKDARNTTDPAY